MNRTPAGPARGAGTTGPVRPAAARGADIRPVRGKAESHTFDARSPPPADPVAPGPIPDDRPVPLPPALPAMARVTLQVLEGLERGLTFPVETPVTIGREEENSVRLNDERVSRFHAKLQEDGGRVILTDLESTNGTRVNGRPVSLRVLRPGDQISIGRCLLAYGSRAELDRLVAAAPAANRTPASVRAVAGGGSSVRQSSHRGLAVGQAAAAGRGGGKAGGEAFGDRTPARGRRSGGRTASRYDAESTGGAAGSDEPSAAGVAVDDPADAAGEEAAGSGPAFVPPGERPPVPGDLDTLQRAQLCDLLGHVHEELRQALLAAEEEDPPGNSVGSIDPGPALPRTVAWTIWQRLMRLEMDLAEALRAAAEPA